MPNTIAASMYGRLKITAWITLRVITIRNGIPVRISAQIRSAGPPAPVGRTANAPSSPTAIWPLRRNPILYAPSEKTP